MYAIVKIAGVQVKATPDEILEVPRLSAGAGETVQFDDVLLVNDGKSVRVGQPNVQGAHCTAEIVEHARGPKVVVGTFKRRKDFRRKKGHRQELTRIRVKKIVA